MVAIGREVRTVRGGWVERRDTRLAPGETRRVVWKTSASGDGVRVHMAPPKWLPD